MDSSDRRYRGAGLGCLVVGAMFSWWGIWRPLAAVQAHETQVDLTLNFTIGAPAMIVFGLFFLIGGARWQWIKPATHRLTAVGWLLVLIATLTCLASYYYFKHQLNLLGYDVVMPDGTIDR